VRPNEIRRRIRDLAVGVPLARVMLYQWRRGAPPHLVQEVIMLYYAALFFVIALVAAILGFGGIAVGAAEIAKILFVVFLVLFLGSLILGMLNKRNP
jgi:uncharacterized membrane protein YtjA (UPF0391 family)